MSSKKVAFLLSGLNAGGTENYLLRFLQFYSKDIEATVYCKSGKLGELESEFKKIGVKLIPFYVGYFNLKRFYLLKKEFEKNNFDTVCDLTGSFGALPLLMARWGKIHKRVAFYRNSSEKFSKTFFKIQYNKFITKLLPKVATKILSNSKTAFNYFYPNFNWQDDSKFEVIYNGIDAASFLKHNGDLRNELNIDNNAFVVGHVGRLNEQKNHDTMIKVAKELCKTNKDIVFIFCGKNVGEKYEDEIKKEGLQNQIRFLGMRRDIDKVLRTMNCFYFPSFVEGQPNALIEALMVGLPFVASNIEPIKETIPEEFYNQLILPKASEDAIIKILELKNNSQIRQELNLSQWAINYYKPEKWFSLFYKYI